VRVVLDSSATLAWIYGDETTEAIRLLYERVADEGALVPMLWRLEVANALTLAVRRGRIDVDFRDAALRDLAVLDIISDRQTDAQAWAGTLHLADAHRLTLYDAAYLELALRHSLPLASLDRDLCTAANRAGVALLLSATGEPQL
jgi:predicted nucleic acid-binding protein